MQGLTYANGVPVFPITPDQRAAVLALYNQYDLLLGRSDPALIGKALAIGLRNAIHDAYGQVQQGGRLEQLRDRLKIGVRLCPYCGFGEVTDLDHHLPRAVYRALSIYGMNLVPCCGRCNNKKRAAGALATGNQFVHTYFDAIPDVDFLLAKIEFIDQGLVVTFEISPTAGLVPDLHACVAYQFERLDLNKRYQAQVNNLLLSHRTALNLVYGDGEDSDELKLFLESVAADAARDFGRNDWRTAFWRAAAASEEFCEGGFKRGIGERELAAG